METFQPEEHEKKLRLLAPTLADPRDPVTTFLSVSNN